jgi:hypothetical protein
VSFKAQPKKPPILGAFILCKGESILGVNVQTEDLKNSSFIKPPFFKGGMLGTNYHPQTPYYEDNHNHAPGLTATSDLLIAGLRNSHSQEFY